jgi:hypothetical protein
MNWFLDGVVGAVIGALGGTAAGYRIGVKSTRQSQKAGDNSTQTQIGRDQTSRKSK